MLYSILNESTQYLCYIIGAIIQITFISLPVTLKNWEDDTLNSLSYVGFQLFVAGIIFIIAPWVFEVKTATLWVQFFLLGATAFIAIFRVIRLIPLEFTFTTKVVNPPTKDLVFVGFNTIERLKFLRTLDFSEPDTLERYNQFRERLLRLRQDTTSETEEDDDEDEG